MKLLKSVFLASTLLCANVSFAAINENTISDNLATTHLYWNDKNRTAHKFISSDSKYRFYKPKITATKVEGNIAYFTVQFTLNHLRSGTSDDQMIVDIDFNATTRSVTKETVKIKWGNEEWQEFTRNIGEVASNSSNTKAAAVGQLIALTGDIYLSIVGIDHGGRTNFASVLHHKSAQVIDATLKALP